ncbi:EAL domain-containing protein [Rhodanobacter sp. Si-c]|uniref:EAL domain-containing protein n=1 Tax=Rhodanobacter lycopersici TaxID=3162487 RepID=A0ABV3QF08_9GAMM
MNGLNSACMAWLVCCLAATSGAAAPASGPATPAHIRVVSDNNYPPFVFLDSDGKPQGYEVDMWRLFQAHTGIQVELAPTDWATAQKELQSGRADVIDMLYRTPSREALYDFSAPYATLSIGIYVDRRISGIRDASALRGFPVGVERGDACVDKLQSMGITDLRLYTGYREIIQAATQGDLRVFCMDEYPAEFYLYRYSALDRYYRAFVLYTDHFHRAVRKGNTPMLRAVERGMALVTPAERAALRGRWLEQPSIQKHYERIIGIALGVVLALVALMALWVWALRRTVAARTYALREEEGKLRAIFDASPDAMWVKDREGIYRDGNDRVVELFRIGRKDLIGHRCDELFDAEFASRIQVMDEEVMRLGRHHTYLSPVDAGEDTTRRFEIIKVPLYTPEGSVRGVLSVARDVTERLQTEARLQLWAHAFQNATFGVVIFDARTHRIIAANPTFARERGYTPEEMVGMLADALYPPDLVAERAAARLEIDRQEHAMWETEHLARDGRRFPVLLDCSIFHDDDGNARYALVYAQDITGREQAESELRLAAAAFQAQEALMVMDADRMIQRVNMAFTALTGFRSDEVMGKHSSMLRSPQHEPAFYERLWEQVQREGFWQGERWIRIKQGEPRVVRTTISAVMDAAGQVSHFVCSMIDLTSEREAHASVDRMTFFDPLTDLPNRHFLHGRLQHLLGGTGAGGAALLLIDLDHFKRVNDLRGHAAGDRLLSLVAQRLRGLLGDECVLSHFNGGTFALLVPCHAEDPAVRSTLVRDCAEGVREALREPFQLDDGAPVGVTASIGWVELVPGRDSPESVLKEAELAMYDAKAGGRDQVRRFVPAMQVELARREALVGDLRRAIADETLQWHLQAQVNRWGGVIGAEMLLRWTRPCGEQVSPEQFIPIAEENGLVLPLGDWVLRQACARLAAWSVQPRCRDLSLAVNVSARQFAQPDFVDGVCRVLAAAGADPARLTLEITETAILGDLAEAAAKLHRLRAHGIRIALDDFGTGYSSLAYLSRLPLDQLKIDHAFVARLPENANDAMVAQTIIGMGRGLDLEVVAEGVETVAQRDFLMAQGCDTFQGFLISRPMPPPMFEAMLAEQPAQD